MAQKIQAWSIYGPRLDLGKPLSQEEFIENIVAVTNQSKGSILAVLAEQDVQVEAALRSGRIVHLPNGMHLEPVGKRDGSIEIHVRVSPEMAKKVNLAFRGTWINAENIGKSEAEIMELWNAEHPEDPIEGFTPAPAPAPTGP